MDASIYQEDRMHSEIQITIKNGPRNLRARISLESCRSDNYFFYFLFFSTPAIFSVNYVGTWFWCCSIFSLRWMIWEQQWLLEFDRTAPVSWTFIKNSRHDSKVSRTISDCKRTPFYLPLQSALNKNIRRNRKNENNHRGLNSLQTHSTLMESTTSDDFSFSDVCFTRCALRT